MEMKPYIVYVKPNDSSYITAVNSSAFLTDITDWVEIDSGYGDKYHHAQGNYFEKPIMTMGGAYHYKLVDSKAVECTEEEIAEQEEANKPVEPDPVEPDPVEPDPVEPDPDLMGRVETLEEDSKVMKEALEMILSGVAE